MRRSSLRFGGIAALPFALAFFACKSDPLPGEQSGSTFVQGAGGGCSGIAFTGECGACVESRCCDVTSACYDDAECAPCVESGGTSCQGAKAEAYLACVKASCQPACAGASLVADCSSTAPATGTCVSQGGGNECDPISNAPCDGAAGETCDAKDQGGFACFPTSKALAGLCEPCDVGQGQFCEAGTRCYKGRCARYCCDEADCGEGRCERVVTAQVGLCVIEDAAPSTSATSTSGGAGAAGP